MPLAGDQKRAYQREYMRRRRAGQPPPPPKPWQPSDRMLSRVEEMARDKRKGRLLRRFPRFILDGLDLNGDGWQQEACNRLREHEAEVRRERKERANAEPPEPRVPHCLFCNEPASDGRIMVADRIGCWHICEHCISECADLIAAKRASPEALARP
jgi:hypothetical protein